MSNSNNNKTQPHAAIQMIDYESVSSETASSFEWFSNMVNRGPVLMSNQNACTETDSVSPRIGYESDSSDASSRTVLRNDIISEGSDSFVTPDIPNIFRKVPSDSSYTSRSEERSEGTDSFVTPDIPNIFREVPSDSSYTSRSEERSEGSFFPSEPDVYRHIESSSESFYTLSSGEPNVPGGLYHLENELRDLREQRQLLAAENVRTNRENDELLRQIRQTTENQQLSLAFQAENTRIIQLDVENLSHRMEQLTMQLERKKEIKKRRRECESTYSRLKRLVYQHYKGMLLEMAHYELQMIFQAVCSLILAIFYATEGKETRSTDTYWTYWLILFSTRFVICVIGFISILSSCKYGVLLSSILLFIFGTANIVFGIIKGWLWYIFIAGATDIGLSIWGIFCFRRYKQDEAKSRRGQGDD